MREDMAKVIVERPRINMRWSANELKGRKRREQKLGHDLPKREGIKRRSNGGTKILNEHLGPLRRYLNSQVGRPWNKVFSEICKHINRNNAVQDHVRDHIRDFVETSVVLIEGLPQPTADRDRNGHLRSRFECRIRQPLYVCPKTGLLRRVKRKRKRSQRTLTPPAFVRVSKKEVCKVVRGKWCLVSILPTPSLIFHADSAKTRVIRAKRDIVLDKPAVEVSEERARKEYGAKVYAASYRLLRKRELPNYPIPIEFWNL